VCTIFFIAESCVRAISFPCTSPTHYHYLGPESGFFISAHTASPTHYLGPESGFFISKVTGGRASFAALNFQSFFFFKVFFKV
jgi:hypothetical protein